MQTTLARAWLLAVAPAAGLACPPINPPIPPLPPTEPDAGAQVRPSLGQALDLDLMGWDQASRVNLNRLRKQGVVAAHYEMKEGAQIDFEVLSDCIGAAKKYTFDAYSARDVRIVRSSAELHADVPLWAARFSGKLAANRAIRSDYMVAGSFSVEAGATFSAGELRGNCSRATHIVSVIHLGGFAMAAGATSSLIASASIFGASADRAQSALIESVASEGDAVACQNAQQRATEDPACDVPLRIQLVPLTSRVSSTPDVVLDFDSIETYAFPNKPVDADDSYLRQFGIKLTAVTAGTRVVILNHLGSYEGKAFIPVSPPNVLAHIGSNDPASFTLSFPRPVAKLSFTLPPLVAATKNGITFPAWRAHALDIKGNELTSVGNTLHGSYQHEKAVSYTLEGSLGRSACINSVRFDSDNGHFAAFNGVLLDDLALWYGTSGQCR